MAQARTFKMFKTTRLRFEQLRQDISDYIQDLYKESAANLNTASPLMQVLYVVANLGRMILFYIESAMNETNITTAVHDRSIKAISTLTGHNPSRGMAARGAVKLYYNMSTEYDGDTVVMSNYTKIRNNDNGLVYLLAMSGSSMQYTVGHSTDVIEIPIIQGEIHKQQATGTGLGMQSFNFSAGSYEIIDDFCVNVYVNSERWRTVESFIDLTYNEKACVVKTSANNGLDVFFGNNVNGSVPDYGAIIQVEYIVCSGINGNIVYNGDAAGSWEFVDSGILLDGTAVDLNSIFTIKTSTDVMFGNDGEDISMTKALAPHASRSFVLANKTNYEYFLRKLNMFSVIDTIQGFNTYEDTQAEANMQLAQTAMVSARESYNNQVALTGVNSRVSKEKYQTYLDAQKEYEKAQNILSNAKLDDNVIYLFLVPNLNNRIDETNNYFTCSQSAFKLSDTEKENILNLLDNSGQKLLTVDNQILDPKMPKFAINMFVQMWSNYEFESVKANIISAISDYLLNMTRRDKIPVSDFIRIADAVEGVDSVTVFFDADVNNSTYYGDDNYGIDKYGDIVICRTITDVLGNQMDVRDLFPIFRGPFTSKDGIEYSDDITSLCSVINVTLRGKSDAELSNKLNIIK